MTALKLVPKLPPLAVVHQLQFNFGIIKLDKSLRLANAHHIKDYRSSKSVDSLINELLDDMSKEAVRFSRTKYQVILSNLLANLFYASSHGKAVLYERNNNSRSNVLLKVIEYLARKQLIDSNVQPANTKGNASFVIAMPELATLLNVHKIRVSHDKNSFKPLVLRGEKTKVGRKKIRGTELSTLRLREHRKSEYKALIKATELHNSYWENNAVTLSKKVIIPHLHRVFNINTDLGGRFYGAFQELPSKDRESLLFNRKPTTELDYSSLHIAILYAWRGLEMIGDPYTIKGYEDIRPTIKGIFLRLVNVNSISALQGVITHSSKASNKERHKRYVDQRKQFEITASKGLAARAPIKPSWYDSFIENVPAGFDSKQFIIDLMERHSAIKDLLGEDNIGLKLQRADSELISNLLVDLYDRKTPVPCLPVHDSLVCRSSNSELVRLTMEHHFKLMFNTRITVK
jgi:hypothetical protein